MYGIQNLAGDGSNFCSVKFLSVLGTPICFFKSPPKNPMCFCFDAVDGATLMSDCDGPPLAILVALVYSIYTPPPKKGK